MSFSNIVSTLTGHHFNCRVTHYEVDLDFWPRSNRLSCRVHITIIPNSPSDSYSLLLGQKYQLDSVSYLGIPAQMSVKSFAPGLKNITARLPRKTTPGEKITLLFAYSGPFPWYPGQHTDWELAPEDYWYPFIPREQQYTSIIRITTPEQLRIIASGQELEERRQDTRNRVTWRMSKPGKGLHLVSGDYYRTQREGLHPLTVCYPRSLMNQAKTLASHWEKILTRLPDLCGPLGLPSSIIVVTSRDEPRTISSQYITSIAGKIIEDLKEIQDRSQKLYAILASELAHRVLKANLKVACPAHAWYLEGLAEYTAWCASLEEFGKHAQESLLQEARIKALATVSSLEDCPADNSLTYPDWVTAKSAWLMRMTHGLVGDDFFPATRKLLGESSFVPEPRIFFQKLGEETRTDLTLLYKEWAATDHLLDAIIEDARSFTDDSDQWQLVFTLNNRGKLRWPHPIEIVIKLADGGKETHLMVLRKEPHLLITPSRVVEVLVDPHMTVLNRGKTRYQLQQ